MKIVRCRKCRNVYLISTIRIVEKLSTVYTIHEDDGYTGTNFTRPGFQLLLQDIKEKRLIAC
ncbi:MAG: hypothetical protein ACERKZ_19110 [Lachnotalea sp.]